MDDILVFINTIEDHESIVQEILHILQENNLYLKPEKCNFKTDHIDYLGIIVGNGTVHMDPKKDCTSRFLRGVGHVFSTDTFFGSMRTVPLPTMIPK